MLEDRAFFNTKTSLDYFVKKISNKINLGYPKSEFKNIATNSQLREVLSIDYQYGIQFRNAFHSLLILIPGVNGKQKTGKVQNVVASSYGYSVKHRPALEMKALCAADLSRISGYSKKVGTSSKKKQGNLKKCPTRFYATYCCSQEKNHVCGDDFSGCSAGIPHCFPPDGAICAK